MGDWSAGGWILMAVMMVAFWGLIIVFAVWLVRSLGSGDRPQRGVSAIEPLTSGLREGDFPDEQERRSALGPQPRH
jgi:hypothetical protein